MKPRDESPASESPKQRWDTFSESLGLALELPAEERAQWLEALAGRDRELAEAVGSALAARAREGFAGFLEEPLVGPGDAPASPSLVGRHVGPYLVEAEIGRGGMGSVWRARRADERYQGRVAIKFLHASWSGRAGEQRFRSEGQILGRLDHPNIARLIDAGVLEPAQPYLVLEFVEGEPIDEYCMSARLKVEARVRLFLSVLAAVSHAHSHLIVHRDIKPSNILVTREGTVKLLDFGIAKLLDDEAASGTTRSGVALTPQYAAPEQILGKSVTTQTDVYALGLVLYQLLTGSYPYLSSADSHAELVQAVLKQDVPRASAAITATTTRASELRGDLDNILAKAMKKTPTARYASVGAFADDLQRFLAHEPVQARPDTAAYVVAKFVRRHRGSVVAGLLVALGLISTSSFAIYQLLQARAERDVAIAEAKRADAEADLAQFLGGDGLSKAPQDAVHERLDRARRFVVLRFHNNLPLAARLLIDLSAQYVDIGDERTGADVIVQAEKVGKSYDDQELLGLIACLRAADLAIANDLAGARKQLADGKSRMRALRRITPGLRAECASAEAFILQADGNFAGAASELREAVDYLRGSGKYGEGRYVSLANDLSNAYLLTADYRAAWQVERELIAMTDEYGRTDTPQYFVYATGGCVSLRSGGQPRRSVEFGDSIESRAYRRAPNLKLPYYFEACRAYSQIAAGGNGSVAAERVLMSAAQEGEDAGMLMVVVGYRASAVAAALDRGDVASAEGYWRPLAAVETRLRADHDRGVDIVRLLSVHARLDLAHGQIDDALAHIREAAALIAARHQPTNRDGREVALITTQVLLARHANEEALRQAQAAVDIARVEAIDPHSSAWIGEALVWRARAEAALGNKRAAASAEEALPHLVQNLEAGHPLIRLARQLATTGTSS